MLVEQQRYVHEGFSIDKELSIYDLLFSDNLSNPYMYFVMQTKTQWSSNTYMPFLKEADDMYLSRESNGQRIVYEDVYIECQNAANHVCDNEKTEEEGPLEIIPIMQNEDGIDTEDRIIKLKEYIRKYPKLC